MEAYYYGQIQLIAKKRREESKNQENSGCVNNTIRTDSGSSLVSSVSRSSLNSNSSTSEKTPLNKNYSTFYNGAYDTNSLD